MSVKAEQEYRTKCSKMGKKQLEKELQRLGTGKKAKRQPDEKQHHATLDKIQQNIDSMVVEAAKLAYGLEQGNKQIEVKRKENEQHRGVLDQSTEQLNSLRDDQKEVTRNIRSIYNGRRIRDPAAKKTEIQTSIRDTQRALQTETLTNTEEKNMIRNLKVLKTQLEEVELYISKGVNKKQEQRDDAKGKVTNHLKSHDEVFDQFKKSRDALDKVYENVKDLRKQREELMEKVKAAKDDKNTKVSEFRDKQDEYNDWRKKVQIVQGLLSTHQFSEDINAQTQKLVQNQKEKDNEKENKKKKKEEEKNNEEQRIKDDAEQRRLQAKMEYEQNRKEFAALKNQTNEQVVEHVAEEIDIYKAEKNLCRNLIALCEELSPQESPDQPKKKGKKKRRKKNQRLKHQPQTFGNFEKVGIKVPLSTKDLPATIELLQEKIASYGKQPAEESKKEEQENNNDHTG